MSSYDPSGRIKRIPAGMMMPPGTCCTCGTVTGTDFADLDVSIDWFGALYLCESCIMQAATVFGGISNVEEEALRDEIKTLTDLVNVTQSEVSRLEKLNESYRTIADDLRRSSGIAVDAPAYLYDEPDPDEPDSDAGEVDGDVHDGPDDSAVEDTGVSEPSFPESGPGDTEDPESDDDSVTADSIERAFEALIDEPGSASESLAGSGADGGKPVGRLFGE
jgi:hypothetical protein